MTHRTIHFEQRDRVARFTLNAPPLNIIGLDMMEELGSAWNSAVESGARVAVIRGAGPRAFSAGVEVGDHVPERVPLMLERLHGLIRSIRQSDVICIAAVHGHVLGGGAELALACDLVIADEDARFGQPEIRLGCYPPVAAALLPARIGWQRSMEVLLSGEPFDAREAQRLGLVNCVVGRELLEQTVEAWVSRILSWSDPVVRLIKQTLRECAVRPFPAALEWSETNYLEELTRVEDMSEGIQAFLEKRAPVWKHR